MNPYEDDPHRVWDKGVAKAKDLGRRVIEALRQIFPPLRTKPQKDEAERKRREREQREREQRKREEGRGQEREQDRDQDAGRDPIDEPFGREADEDALAEESERALEGGPEPTPGRAKPTREQVLAELGKLAAEIDEVQRIEPMPMPGPSGRRGRLDGDPVRRRMPAPPSEEAQRAAEEIKADLVDMLQDELGGGVGSSGGESFEVHFHPTERRISAVRGPKRAAEKGTAITRIERLPVDGMVFDRKRPGGSVVIDQSGSMHLSYDAVAAAIETFPALTIARYSGRGGTGTLCVLAEHGQLGALGDCTAGRGNDVDIEALSWLAKQPEPRVWVSDGQVCGGLVDVLGDEQAHQVITSLCQRSRIVRVGTFEEAVHVLQRGTTRGVAVTSRDEDFLPGLSRSL